MGFDIDKQLERAKRHLEKNKLEDAIAVYQSILNEAPGHLEALQGLGDLHTRLNQSDRAAAHYGILFDRFFDTKEENKALAIYTRALKGLQQPPDRMAKYALLLQKQGRNDEAIEQYSLASEVLLARGKDLLALDCLERLAQLDPERVARQFAVGELAERLGKKNVAARGFLRAGQLSEAAGEDDAAIELLARAHDLLPRERGPALLYAQALLRRGDAAGAAKLLEPLSSGELDTAFLTTFGESLMSSGALDRARGILERLPPEQPATARKLFDLAACYVTASQDENAVSLLKNIERQMVAVHHENDFAARLDSLMESHSGSVALARFCATAFAELNRESKYFDSLVRLFDLQLNAGNVAGASEAFEKLVEIDPYDSQNQQRLDRLEGRADAGVLSHIRMKLSQVATHAPESATIPAENTEGEEGEPSAGQESLDDLIVQAEIFIQYALQGKAVERLERIAARFPGEEQRNDRLRNLYGLANWWPARPGGDPAPETTARPKQREAAHASESADTIRDLGKISEISQSLFRLPSPRAILSSAINEMGRHLRATRCIALIGAPGKPPQMASEFCAPGVGPASGALLGRLLAQLERAAPDALGGLPLEAAAAPVLRELGLETALAVVLIDSEMQTQAGMAIAGHASAHQWRPNETYFLQAVGDQMLLGVNHTRLRTMVRTVGIADERTGLLARSSYQDCLLGETRRAKSQGTALALALIQIDKGADLMRLHGEMQLETHMEQLARALEPVIRQSDLAVKYTSWTIAFILPDTALAGAQTLAEKLRATAMQVESPWHGGAITLSASVAEAVTRPEYDSEDIVTELINRAEAGLEEAHNRGGDSVVALKILGN